MESRRDKLTRLIELDIELHRLRAKYFQIYRLDGGIDQLEEAWENVKLARDSYLELEQQLVKESGGQPAPE